MTQTFNIEAFLRKTTHAIWDAKKVGQIDETYTHNAQIRVSGQLIYSRESWMTEVLQWQAMFPDLRIFIEDMIWQQDPNGGFRASTRCVFVGTHLGAGRLGPPTGKRIAKTMIINQQIWDGRIVEEWREENEMGMLEQLDLFEFPSFAQAISEEDSLQALGEIERLQGQFPAQKTAPKKGQRFDAQQFISQVMDELWNERMVGRIQEYYDAYYRGHGSSRGELYGAEDLQKEMLALLAAFPDLRYFLDDFCWMGNVRVGFRTATRWTILGTHESVGKFGPPTGKRIRITGITHHRIHIVSEAIEPEGRIQEEWTELSENLLYRTLNLLLKEIDPFFKPSLEESS